MERSLPDSTLVYANKENAKRHQMNGYQPENKAKRNEDDSLSPYIYYATEPDDEDPPSI